MNKLIIGFERKSDLTRAQCHDHLTKVHGPLVKGVGEFSRHLRGYTQNLAIEDPGDSKKSEFNLDAVVEIRFENLEALNAAYVEPRYLQLIRPDEQRFANLSRLLCAWSREEVVFGSRGASSSKYIRFLLAPNSTSEELLTAWKLTYPAYIRDTHDFLEGVQRYVRNWPDPDAGQIFPSDNHIVCIEEFWLSGIPRDVFLRYDQKFWQEHDDLSVALCISQAASIFVREFVVLKDRG